MTTVYGSNDLSQEQQRELFAAALQRRYAQQAAKNDQPNTGRIAGGDTPLDVDRSA